MQNFQATARSTLVAAAWAVLFIASLSSIRYVGTLADRASNFASWHLRGTVEAE